MGKIRDYNAELKALEDRTRGLKAKRIEQLGGLVTSTRADTLDLEMLAGALLDAVAVTDTDTKEAWRVKGAAFFQRRGRKGRKTAESDDTGTATQPGADPASGSDAAAD